MNILCYCPLNERSIRTSLGLADYSYYFVLKEFLPLLQSLATVEVFDSLSALEARLQAGTGQVLVLAFVPPQKTPLQLSCPVLPVFAWEFDSIPDQVWDDEPRHDWRRVFAACPRAITHSQYAVQAVRRTMGAAYPVCSLPAPLWDRCEPWRQARRTPPTVLQLRFQGRLLDSAMPGFAQLHEQEKAHVGPAQAEDMDTRSLSWLRQLLERERAARRESVRQTDEYVLSLREHLEHAQAYARSLQDYVRSLEAYRQAMETEAAHWQQRLFGRWIWLGLRAWSSRQRFLPAAPTPQGQAAAEPCRLAEAPAALDHVPTAGPTAGFCELKIEHSVVYTAVFNPYDGRKNWRDMVSAFCAALGEHEDACLLLKLTHQDIDEAMAVLHDFLLRLPPFRCRVVAIHGFLEAEDYAQMVAGSSYALNTSLAEGQCLPLMEFMSAGVPAVAPDHSAMRDYMDASVGFVVRSHAVPACWQHDPLQRLYTHAARIDWSSLCQALRDSYACKPGTAAYQALAQAAVLRLQGHCSQASAAAVLAPFLQEVSAHAARPV